MIIADWIIYLTIPPVFILITLGISHGLKLKKVELRELALYMLCFCIFSMGTVLGLLTWKADIIAIVVLYPILASIVISMFYMIFKKKKMLNALISTQAQNINASLVQLNASAEQISMTAENMASRTSEIGLISSEIKNITKKTQLLALNATIEAGRAGEAGKGFSVVAKEITKLSKESNRATERIRRLLKEIPTDFTEISSATQEQTASTEDVSENMHRLALVVGRV